MFVIGVQLLSQYDDNDILQFVLKRLANEPIQVLPIYQRLQYIVVWLIISSSGVSIT